MDLSNMSSASAPACVGDDGTAAAAAIAAWPPTTMLSSAISSRLALLVDPAASAHDSCLLGLGVTSALYALLWVSEVAAAR